MRIGIFAKKINIKTITREVAFYCIVILCIIMAGGAITTIDYESFEFVYYNAYTVNVEPGYLFLCKLCLEMGLSYQGFRLILFSIAYLILFSSLGKISGYSLSLLFAYIAYPMCYDAYNIKNTLMMSIIVKAIVNLVNYEKPKYLKSIIFFIIAVSIHRAAVIYIVMIAVIFAIERKKIKPLFKMLLGIALCYFIACIIYRPLIAISVGWISNMILESSILRETYGYLTTEGNWGFLIYLIPSLCMLFISYCYLKSFDNSIMINENKTKLSTCSERYFYITVITCLYMLIVINNSTTFRLIRNIFVVSYAYIIGMSQYFIINSQKKYLLYARTVMIIMIIYCVLVFTFGAQKETFVRMFTDNWILKGV